MHGVHHVKFTDRLSEGGDLEDVDALVLGPVEAGATIPVIYAIENGRLEKKTGPDGNGTPHGDSAQGYTWH